MTKRSPREIEHAVEKLTESQTESDTTESEITVLWGSADPENRPEGMTYVEETGTLTYDLWGAQRRALEALEGRDTDIVGFLAGYGSGKTIFGTRWLLKQALDHAGSRFLCMGIDFQKARDTTFRVLFEQLPGERTGIVTSSYNGPEQSPIVADYNRQNHRLTLVNDSVIKLGSADRWNRYAGDEYGAVHLDEPSHYGEDLHDLLEMIGSRLRGVAGPQTQLWTLTGNGHNAAFDILERQEDSTGDELGLGIAVIRASTLENPYLNTGEKERFERQYGNTAREQQALHGGFAAASGTLLSRDQLQFLHVDAIPDRECRYHIGVDLSYLAGDADAKDGDYTAATVVAVDSKGERAYAVDCFRTRGKTLREGLQWLEGICRRVPHPTVKIEDVGGQTFWVQEAREMISGTVTGISPGTQSKESRLADMGVLFERGDVVLVNYEIDENLGYDPRWKEFVREWCQVGQSDSSPDTLDSAWYALQNINLRRGDSIGIVTGDAYGGGW